MASFPTAFTEAVNHAMLYEVGGFWDLDAVGAREGSIDTKAACRACGYVNDPDDPGGETKYGIAQKGNPDLDITSLDWEQAQRIYFRRYWLPAHCDEIAEIHPRVAVLHFDSAVNHGVSRAAIFLQRALGAVDDGDIGPATIGSVIAADPIRLCSSICDQRAAFYRDIVARKPVQGKYLKGWLRRIEEMRAFTTSPDLTFV